MARRRWNHESAADILRASGAEPREPYSGYGKPWKCECLSCHQIVTPRFSNVLKGHSPCRPCWYRKNGLRQRRTHESAERLMVENDLRPLEPYPGALKPWKCRCMRCGEVAEPRFNAIQQGQGGCQRRAQEAGHMRAGLRKPKPYPSCGRHAYSHWSPSVMATHRGVADALTAARNGHRHSITSNRVIAAALSVLNALFTPRKRMP